MRAAPVNAAGWGRSAFLLVGVSLATAALFIVGESQGWPVIPLGQGLLLVALLAYAAGAAGTRITSPYFLRHEPVSALMAGLAAAGSRMCAALLLGLAAYAYAVPASWTALFVLAWLAAALIAHLVVQPVLRAGNDGSLRGFFAVRYGEGARVAADISILAFGFVFLVAQIQAVGLITSHFFDLQFSIAVFAGLAAMLACVFIRGLRSASRIQALQTLAVLTACLLPLAFMLPRLVAPQAPVSVAAAGEVPGDPDAAWLVRQHLVARAELLQHKIETLPESLYEEQVSLRSALASLQEENASVHLIGVAQKRLHALPADPEAARLQWLHEHEHLQSRLGVTPPAGKAAVLALIFMLGGIVAPHLLVDRQARAHGRRSAAWTCAFLMLLLLVAVGLAGLVRIGVQSRMAGINPEDAPAWLLPWIRSGLAALEDVNDDGLLQLPEMHLEPDALGVLAPQMASMPAVLSALVAVAVLLAGIAATDAMVRAFGSMLARGGKAASRSEVSASGDALLSRAAVLVIAVGAGLVAMRAPDDLLSLLAVAMSLASATLLTPLAGALVLRRTSGLAAVWAMLSGLAVTVFYLLLTHPFLGGQASWQWLGLPPEGAGVAGLLVAAPLYALVSVLVLSRSKQDGRIPDARP